MSPRARKACPVAGCFNLTNGGRCADHKRESDQARGTSTERGYKTRGHLRRFRPGVLARDQLCVLCVDEGRPPTLATVADHWPLSRRELLEQGLDPDDPQHGRGLCKRHHDRETARHQPGGWNT